MHGVHGDQAITEAELVDQLPGRRDLVGLVGDLTRQLPSRPAGQEYAIVDNDVVLIEAATGLILDILVDMAGH